MAKVRVRSKRPAKNINKRKKKRSPRRAGQMHVDLRHLIELSWCVRREVFLAAIPDFGVISWGESYEEALHMLAKASMLTMDLVKIYKNKIPNAVHRPQWLKNIKE